MLRREAMKATREEVIAEVRRRAKEEVDKLSTMKGRDETIWDLVQSRKDNEMWDGPLMESENGLMMEDDHMDHQGEMIHEIDRAIRNAQRMIDSTDDELMGEDYEFAEILDKEIEELPKEVWGWMCETIW